MTRALIIGLCAVLAACASSGGLEPPHLCETDAECVEGQVCFPLEGCGDPGGGLVVEVKGNIRNGQLPQDFPIDDGGFAIGTIGDGGLVLIKHFQMQPATVRGEFSRDTAIYSSPVTVSARGSSDLIPGEVRTTQAVFEKTERGTYSLPVGAGHYVVTAEPNDGSIPPVEAEVIVGIGTNSNLSFAFSSIEKTITMSGTVLKRIDSGPPSINIPVQVPMDVQAFDPHTLRPLSQRTRCSLGGVFTLFVSPAAQALGSFVVVATPRDAEALVPSKTFEIKLPLEQEIRLVMGEFGDPLPQMIGDVRTTGGVAVEGASVYLEGPVTGGGTFRSKVVFTDSKGVFRVDLLPSSNDGSYLLTALPTADSPAGVVQKQVKAVSRMAQLPYLQVVGGLENSTAIVCPDKITVIGNVRLPGGIEPAGGTRVVAHAIEQLKELGRLPLSMGETTTKTSELGAFTLELDPGVYQLDFIPGEELPRTTRIITVRAPTSSDVDAGPPSRTVDLKEFELRKGRKVTGTVTVTAGNANPVIVENAGVRYFRVSAVGGVTTALLLGETVADSMGNYSLMLPSK